MVYFVGVLGLDDHMLRLDRLRESSLVGLPESRVDAVDESFLVGVVCVAHWDPGHDDLVVAVRDRPLKLV